ncbi:MAG: hypothetical protein Q8Q73_08745 [Stagnimonas sp.]|nr:hypothetical protein [Stagnimonas sp.]
MNKSITLALLAGLAAAVLAPTAQARTDVHIGIGLPYPPAVIVEAPRPRYYSEPYYYYREPVVYYGPSVSYYGGHSHRHDRYCRHDERHDRRHDRRDDRRDDRYWRGHDHDRGHWRGNDDRRHDDRRH